MTQDFIFSTRPNTGVVVESTETLVASAAPLGCDANVAVTRTSGTVLSIFNSSSSSAIQVGRFNPFTASFTAAVALTITAGSGSGIAMIGLRLKDDRSTEIFIEDTSGCTFSGTGVVTYPQPGPVARGPKVYLWKWIITAGNFANAGGTASGGTSLQTNHDIWLDELELCNNTGSAATVTLADAQSSPRYSLNTVSIAANSTSLIIWPGGRYFQGGATILAGIANAIDAHYRGIRARVSALIP